MAANGAITLDFGDGTYSFRLAIGQIAALEEACDCGAPVILARLYDSTWRSRDVAETIRQGLIGGGLAPPEALKLVRLYVHDRPWAESVPVARATLMAAILGVPGPDTARDRAAGEPEPATVASTSPGSTPAAP